MPEPAPQQINDALVIDAELEGKAVDDKLRENPDSILQVSLETTAKRKKIGVKDDAGINNILSTTTYSRGHKMIAMALKRPELSTHSIKRTFNKSSRLPGDDVERAVWRRLKKH